MKKIQILTLTSLAVTGGALTLQALPETYLDAFGDPFEPVAVAEAVRTESAITLDGQGNEAVWSEAPEYSLEHVTWPFPEGTGFGEPVDGSPVAEDDLSASFQAAWDDTYLYLLVDVTDDILVIDSEGVGYENDDSLEIYLDGDNSRDEGTAWNVPGQDFINDRQLKVKADETTPVIGGLYDPTEDGTVEIEQDINLERSVVITDTGYQIEIRMNWTGILRTFFADGSLVQEPEEDAYIGFDLKVSDDDDGGERDITYGWASASNDNYASPQLNGTMVLTTGGGAEEPVSPWADLDPANDFGDKETGIGWINDVTYPFIWHYSVSGTGGWMFVLDEFSDLANLFIYEYATDDWYWSSDAFAGWHFKFGDPDYGIGGWEDWTP